VVDEARIFTFSPGNFNPPGEGLSNPPGSDLLPVPVPESTSAQILTIGIGVAALYRIAIDRNGIARTAI
jgi:hypothetical protein